MNKNYRTNMVSTTDKKTKPFIIWTLQRTGGTNLTERLVKRSGLKGFQHEPFNIGRKLGYITEEWLNTRNEQNLADQIQTFLGQNLIIKHCVETVPVEVSYALAEIATNAGYNHLILYRRNSIDRLLSLHFALQTGIWGPTKKVVEIPITESIAEIPVNKLVNHEEYCLKRLKDILQFLISKNANPQVLEYENIYLKDHCHSADFILPVINKLGLCRGDESDLDFLKSIISLGNQGTRDKYRLISGFLELEEAIRQNKPLKEMFHFLEGTYKKNLIETLIEDAKSLENNAQTQLKKVNSYQPFKIVRNKHPSIQHAGLDPVVFNNNKQLVIGGVILTSQDYTQNGRLLAINATGEHEIVWKLPSPGAAKKFPNLSHAALARFKLKLEGLKIKDYVPTEIFIENPSGKRILVFTITNQNES